MSTLAILETNNYIYAKKYLLLLRMFLRLSKLFHCTFSTTKATLSAVMYYLPSYHYRILMSLDEQYIE